MNVSLEDSGLYVRGPRRVVVTADVYVVGDITLEPGTTIDIAKGARMLVYGGDGGVRIRVLHDQLPLPPPYR